MEHVSHIPLAITVIKPFARSELTWFHIPLALARPQEYVSATAFLNGSQGDIMMFVFVAVSDKIFTLIIPFEMSQNLITHVFEIRVVRKIIATAHFDGSNSLSFSLNSVHHTNSVNNPHKSWLPIDAFRNAFQSLVRWHLIRKFLTPTRVAASENNAYLPDTSYSIELRCRCI